MTTKTTDVRLANEAWEGVLTAHATLMRRFAATSAWDHVSMREYDVLYTLSKCDDGQRISDLQRRVLLSQPALSRLVDRLVERGLVSRCEDQEDGRAVRVNLTPEGREMQRTIGRVHARDVADALSALSEDEQRQLAVLTAKLVDAQPARSRS